MGIIGEKSSNSVFQNPGAKERQGERRSAKEIITALKKCSRRKDLEGGKRLHLEAVAAGYHMANYVAASLVSMYMKCGSVERAREVFDNTSHRHNVMWNCLIHGYVENGESSVAIDLFTVMDSEPDNYTYAAVLKAYASLATERDSEKESFLEKGIIIHEQAKNNGYASDTVVATTLVDMYRKCGSIQRAQEVFNEMITRDVVSWNCLILGYVETGESYKALELFISMDCEPNYNTYIAALKGCSSLGALDVGQVIHSKVCQRGMEEIEVLASSLLDFYGKCGRMATAEEVFNNMYSPDIVSWTSLMAGYSSCGESSQVFRLARNVQEAGVRMNCVTFLCVLMACNYAGLVDEGKSYFESMFTYGISPTVEHYNCIIDMLGRANRLEEALCIFKSMPFEGNIVTWTALIGACRKWRNLEACKVAFDALVDGSKRNTSAYVLVRDIYETLSQDGEKNTEHGFDLDKVIKQKLKNVLR